MGNLGEKIVQQDGKSGPRLQPVNRQCSQPFPATVGFIIKYLKPAYYKVPISKVSGFQITYGSSKRNIKAVEGLGTI